MKRLLAIFAIASCVMPLPLRAQSAPDVAPSPDSAGTQAILDARTAAMPGTGIVAAMIDRGVLTTYHSGTAGAARPLDDHTLFEIGSVTKTFTATVLAEMVLAGQVKLSDPVSMYLSPSVHVPSKDGKPITLLSLATQHSGLPRLPSNMTGASMMNPYANYTVEQLYTFLNGYTLPREPGASYEYSNLGFGLLGFALARRAHTTYAQLVRDRVFTPLGMNESSVALPGDDPARLAVGHNVDGDPVHSWEFTDTLAGAGAIRSDLADMVKYLRCNMGSGPLANVCLFAQQPRSTFPGHQIGLAWWTNTTSGSIDHAGDTAGFHALVMMNGDRTKGVVLLSNGPAIIDIGAHMLYPSYPVMAPSQTAAVPAAELDEYAGTYANASFGMNYAIFRKGEKLYAKLDSQEAAAIYPSRPDHFYYRVVQAYIEFIRQNGKIVGLILTQDGQHAPLFRLDASGKPMASKLEPAYPAVVTLDPTVLASYAGAYTIDGTPAYTVTVKDGHVFLQVGGQPAFEMFPSAKDEFYFKIVDAQVTFERDRTGNITGLTLHQDGENIEGTRVPSL